MLYSLLSIAIFIFVGVFTSTTAQQVSSIKSPTVDFLYSFTFRDDTILIGGNMIVDVVDASDLTLLASQSKAVPRFSQVTICLIELQSFCTANVIDHVFQFAESFLACGSNGGEGGCSLLDNATAPIREIQIHLSGNVRPDSSALKEDFIKNSIYFNPDNEFIYSLYENILELFDFTDFAPGSMPTMTSGIPFLITSNPSGTMPQSDNFFFNTPTPGNIFKYEYESSTNFEYIHIPFTEVILEQPVSTGLDYTFLLNSYHGRLARICANDIGQFTSPATFGTFNKITIDCRQALGIRYPTDTYYVSVALKELFIIDPDNIFGFFTSQNTAEEYIQSSTVCKFISDRNDITPSSNRENFDLEKGFKDAYFSGYDPNLVAEMNWDCSDPLSRIVNSIDSTMAATAAQLFEATIVNVLHRTVVYNQASLAFDKHFVSVVMDTTRVVTSNGSEDIVVFYATTFDGYLIKMKVGTDVSLLGEFSVSDSELLNAEIREINGIQYLFAISNSQLLKISLQLCSHYDSAVACQQDPECLWNISTRTCEQYDKVSVREELTLGVVDDTCRISFSTSTKNSLTFNLNCDVMLPPKTPVISAVALDNTAVSMGNYQNDNATSALITVEGLLPLTPYIITVELNYLYGFVPDLRVIEYTEVNLEGIIEDIFFVCPAAADDTTITLASAVTFPDYLQVCAACGSNQFCSVITSSSSVAFDFPWSNCLVTTESFTSTGVKADSSSCTTVQYNRCNQSSPFTHLDFSFETTATTITVTLYNGIPMQQYGITGYMFTINDVHQNLTGNKVMFNSGLKPSNWYTVDYNAYTECGSVFSASIDVKTLDDWSRVENCMFSSDGLIFSYTITDLALCPNGTSNCMDILTSNCELTPLQVSVNTVSYTVTLSTGICTVNVYPAGRIDLLSYYGCNERFSPPDTYEISFGTNTTTTNSVSFNFTITSSSQYFQGEIRLLDTTNNVVQSYSLSYQATGTFATGFNDLDQNTTYTIEISVGNVVQTRGFTTGSSSLSLPCSPLGDYNVVFVGELFDLEIERNNDCPAGRAVTHICLITFDDNNDDITIETTDSVPFTLLKRTFTGLDREKSHAFALVNGTNCSDVQDSEYRCIYSDSLYQTTIVTPTTITISRSTSTPTTVIPGISVALVSSSVGLFYTAVGTSSITVVFSAGGLSVMFALILIYPKLLKKSEAGSNTKATLDTDTYEMSGMNNPIDDTAS